MFTKLSGVILYLLITLFVLTIHLDQPKLLESWELSLYDKFFQLKGNRDVGDDIKIIAIDDASLQTIGNWPWHRNTIAELVDKIAEQSPRVIYLDLPFPDDPQEDALGYTSLLAKSIKQAGNVVLPYRYTPFEFAAGGFTLPEHVRQNAFSQFDGASRFEKNPPVKAGSLHLPTEALAKVAVLGFGGVSFDPDRYVRSTPMILEYASEYLPSASFLVAREFLGLEESAVTVRASQSIKAGQWTIPIDTQSRMRINFSGPGGLFRYDPAHDILSDAIGKRALTGKAVIVAFTGTSSVDIYSTPVSKAMRGAEITANTIENIIHDHHLKGFGDSGPISVVVIIIIGLFSALILPRISLLYRIVALGITLLVIVNLSFVLFTNFDLAMKVFYPIIMIVFFMVCAPAMKLPVRIGDRGEEEADDVDYDAIISGTPITGTRAHTATADTSRLRIGGGQTGGRQTQTAAVVIARSTTSSLPVGTEFFGRYKVLSLIGQGAMGCVYKGLDPAIDRLVALKTIRIDSIINTDEVTELKERLTREAKAAGKLSHPNIVTVYDVGEEVGIQYIAMEYLDGRTLEQYVASQYRWEYKALCKIMIQVCDALHFAHERGIVHRDIKPANIMVLEGDRIKVMDFGIARFDSSNMTQSGIALGTPNYISPEQLKGLPVNRRSDIFSLGVVLYEILTYNKPFKGDTISALIYSILHTSPPAPSEVNRDVPRIFDKIAAKALAKDQDQRFQTTKEMGDILRKLI